MVFRIEIVILIAIAKLLIKKQIKAIKVMAKIFAK